MRLLLDESLPKGLAAHLAGHEVQTAQGAGWAGVANGELLRLAAEAGFDALLTPDRGLEFEQNAETLPVRVVILYIRLLTSCLPGRYRDAGSFRQ